MLDKIFLSSYSRESFFMISSQKLFTQNIKTLLFQSIFINFFSWIIHNSSIDVKQNSFYVLERAIGSQRQLWECSINSMDSIDVFIPHKIFWNKVYDSKKQLYQASLVWKDRKCFIHGKDLSLLYSYIYVMHMCIK